MEYFERLKEARARAGLTQHQVAERLGVGDRAYRHWEAGAREPSIAKLIELADLFGVSIDWLVGRDGDLP